MEPLTATKRKHFRDMNSFCVTRLNWNISDAKYWSKSIFQSIFAFLFEKVNYHNDDLTLLPHPMWLSVTPTTINMTLTQKRHQCTKFIATFSEAPIIHLVTHLRLETQSMFTRSLRIPWEFSNSLMKSDPQMIPDNIWSFTFYSI